jgi:hypothetical protein
MYIKTKEGLILGFYGDYRNESGVSYQGYSFKQFGLMILIGTNYYPERNYRGFLVSIEKGKPTHEQNTNFKK